MTQSDNQGNKFIFDMFPDSIQIKLKLANEQRTRHIGHINCKRQFVVKRRQSAHLHIKSQSYGFNHYLLENAKRFDTILLTDETGSYLINRLEILKEGKFLFFKQQGFELQIFYPIEKIYKNKIENYF